jgi:hypothetical protein
MDVEVDDPAEELQVRQSRLFGSFAESGGLRRFPAFDMPTHLQPAPEPAMMTEQKPPAVIDYVAARGEVTGSKTASGEGVPAVSQQLDHSPAMAGLEAVHRLMGLELGEKSFGAGHQACDGNQ